MPGAVQPPLEPRPPSVRISLRKRTIPKALQETPPSPSRPKKSSKTVAKKQHGGKSSGGAKSKPQQSAGKVPPSETTKSRSSTKGKSHKSGKHSRPWEVDDGDDYVYDYISSPSESESSSSEEEYSLRASRPHVFLDDELDEESIANDTSLNYSDEDSPECSHLPWIDLSPDEIPPLELPESSKDIPIPSEYLMDTVELYELLRSYWRTLRLSPFIFEDFCAALCSPENSRLLSEIHIVLLRMSFKNDDEEQIHFSGNDTNNAYNIITACLEPMTYAEVLRQYLSCDPNVPPEVMEAVQTSNYPFVGFSVRLVLITFLSYRFLYSNEYKRVIVANNGRIEHEETCRSCNKGGDLLMCSTCEAVFHPTCINVESKSSEWICELCEKNKVRGVQDCLPLDESLTRQPLRMEPIGRDRHGRFYWFVVRRIFVHNIDESDLRYYSTAPQFYQLVKRMDPSYFEFNLCNVFFQKLSDILEQMSVTLELSSDRRDTLYRDNYKAGKPLPAEVYLQQNNMRLMADILSMERNETASRQDFKEGSDLEEKPFTDLINCFKTMLGFSNGSLVNNFWSGNMNENELLQAKLSESEECPSKLFRMGCTPNDTAFTKYINFYVDHKFGEHPVTRKKMIDKKKYLCSKFSLMEDGEWAFEWSLAKGHNLYGSERLQTLYIAWTIGKLLRKIPVDLMQRKWRDALPSFKKELESPATSWVKLKDLLLRLECGMRRTLFLPQWWNNLGHTRLTRTTVEDRERLMKEAQRRKKDEREALDVFDEDIVVVKHTKFPQGISRELTRMRDEKYRLYGRGDLGGWIWISRTLVRDIRVKPEEEEITKRKSRRLETIVSRLMDWRLAQEMKGQDQKSGQCHPPGCRSDSAMSDTTTDHQSCYSQDGRRRELDVDDRDFSPPPDELEASSVNTSRIVKAFDQSKVPTIRKGVLGEDLPWPLPDVNKFVSRGSKRTSIFVIPQITLRQLAKTGGRKAIYIPSFSSSAKGNLQYWNYPAPRPCFDLCWRWLTANCKSLQSVALQLRILWASVRWMDMKPEDDDPDRRVVIHYPDRDERQRISFHKEFGPPCIYERYRLSIEVIPLDDDNAVDEEDDSTWAGSERERRRSTRRRKTVQSSNVRRVSHIKEEWVDGVDLKLYEIYDYWKAYNNRPTTSNRQSRLVQKAQSAATSGGRSTSSVPNASNLRNAVAVQSNLRHSYSRPTPSSASLLHHAPTFTTERKRKPSRREDYEYYGFDDDFDDEDDYDSRPNASSEHTGWEPRAAKRRLVSSMDSNQTFRTVVPTSRSSIERSYPVGVLRRGDRNTVPVGDGMEQMEGLIEEGVVPLGAEETIVTTAESSGNQTSAGPASSSTRQVFRDGVGDGDGGLPVMQRYEDVNDSYGGRTVSRVLPSSSARTRVVHRSPAVVSRSNVAVPSAAGKLLMVRRSDGTTQFLRQIPQHSGRPLSSQLPVMRARAPQTAVQTVHGSKLVHIAREDQDQSTPTRVVMPARPAPRVVRTGYGQAVDPFMTRMAVEKTGPGGDVVPSGLVRGHVVRPARGYEQVGAYGASDGRAMENVSYSEHMARVQTSTERTPLPSGYTQRSIIRKVAPRGSAPTTQGVPPNNNSHRVYYVKNPIATPSRVVLAPASVKTNEHEEIVFDNGDQVVDAGEIEDHTQPQHPS